MRPLKPAKLAPGMGATLGAVTLFDGAHMVFVQIGDTEAAGLEPVEALDWALTLIQLAEEVQAVISGDAKLDDVRGFKPGQVVDKKFSTVLKSDA